MSDERKITLRDVWLHAKQDRRVTILDSFEIVIRPWAVRQLEEALPIVSDILSELRGINKDTDIWDAMLPILKKSKEYVDKVVHLVYITMERSNQEIQVTIGDKTHKMPFFTKEEMKEYFDIPEILKIAKIIYSQNIEKNLLTGWGQNQPESTIEDKKILVNREEVEIAPTK